jgi:hypothetical protein
MTRNRAGGIDGDIIGRQRRAATETGWRPAPRQVVSAATLDTALHNPTTAGGSACVPPNDGGPALGEGERKILIAAAQHQGGVTREQLSILTGYKRSTRDAYVQRLRRRGHMAERAGRLIATESGVLKLGSDHEPLPTGAALLPHCLERLPEAERALLELVAARCRSCARYRGMRSPSTRSTSPRRETRIFSGGRRADSSMRPATALSRARRCCDQTATPSAVSRASRRTL